MSMAFVLISTELGSEADMLESLRDVEEVTDVCVVYGVYDVVAKVKAESMDRLKEIITSRIRTLDKVRSTLTLVVLE